MRKVLRYLLGLGAVFAIAFIFAFATYAQNSIGGGRNFIASLWRHISSTVLAPLSNYTTVRVAEICDENGANCADVSAGIGGDVSKVGTPVNNQLGVWTGDGTLEGDADLTWDQSDFIVYEVVNDGNPQVRVGATDAEETHLQSVYDTGAQTLDHFTI